MSEANNSDLIKVNIQYLTLVERKTMIIKNNIEKAFNLYQRLEKIEDSKIAGDIGSILSRIMPFTDELKNHCEQLSNICRGLINNLNTGKGDGKLNSNELIAIKSHIEYIAQYAASQVPELNKIKEYEKNVLETEANLANEIFDNEKYKLNFISTENNIIYKNFEDMKKSVLSGENFNPELLKKFEIVFETFKVEIKNIYDSIFSVEPKDKDWAKKMGIFNEKLKNKNFYDIFVKASKEENYAQIINSELK